MAARTGANLHRRFKLNVWMERFKKSRSRHSIGKGFIVFIQSGKGLQIFPHGLLSETIGQLNL